MGKKIMEFLCDVLRILFYCTAGTLILMFLFHDDQKTDFGPEKTFVVDKKQMNFNPFRPVTISDFCPDDFFYYVQEADNVGTEFERRIIVRRKKDGIFFAVRLKNSSLALQGGQKLKISLVQYWRNPLVLTEYLIAKP